MVVKKAAIKVRRLVRIPNGWQAQMREVLTEFLRLSSLNISVSRFRDAEPCRGSSTTFALCSPCGLRGAFAAAWKELRRGSYLAESSAHYLFNHSGSFGSILWFAKIRPCRGH